MKIMKIWMIGSVLAVGICWSQTAWGHQLAVSPVDGTVTQTTTLGHPGVDIASPEGTPMNAHASGTVVAAGSYPQGSGYFGYGNVVSIQTAEGITMVAGHMATVSVSVGQQVTAGVTPIGTIGNTGISTGAHVHVEGRVNGILGNTLQVGLSPGQIVTQGQSLYMGSPPNAIGNNGCSCPGCGCCGGCCGAGCCCSGFGGCL